MKDNETWRIKPSNEIVLKLWNCENITHRNSQAKPKTSVPIISSVQFLRIVNFISWKGVTIGELLWPLVKGYKHLAKTTTVRVMIFYEEMNTCP